MLQSLVKVPKYQRVESKTSKMLQRTVTPMGFEHIEARVEQLLTSPNPLW